MALLSFLYFDQIRRFFLQVLTTCKLQVNSGRQPRSGDTKHNQILTRLCSHTLELSDIVVYVDIRDTGRDWLFTFDSKTKSLQFSRHSCQERLVQNGVTIKSVYSHRFSRKRIGRSRQ